MADVNINIPSQVSQSITDGVTDKAPSENAVFDALALKADTSDLNGYVPYTGATSDVNLGTYNITADHISLNVSPSGAGFGVGATQWNNTIGSSETLLKGGNVTLKNGVDLVARVVNKVTPNTTLTKANYQAVKVSGAQGGRLAIGLAQGNTDLNSADTIGLVTETIATNQEGFIITVGQLLDINTTGSLQGETWADGDVLYLSPTTAGRLTNVKPTGATGHIVVVGYVEYAHATQGAIYVKIMNGWELDELHNVYINPSTLADNNLLQYDSATSLWKNESLSTAGVQPTLVSGTSIKTINSTSLLGSGNITVIPTHDGATYDTNAIQTLTAAEYAAITPNANTLYFIV
jgi:nitrogen fixation protein